MNTSGKANLITSIPLLARSAHSFDFFLKCDHVLNTSLGDINMLPSNVFSFVFMSLMSNPEPLACLRIHEGIVVILVEKSSICCSIHLCISTQMPLDLLRKLGKPVLGSEPCMLNVGYATYI